MKIILSILVLLVSGKCLASLPYSDFEKQFSSLNSTIQKASMGYYVDSRDYEDKKIPINEKLKSKQSWCELTKARLNLLELIIGNFSEYKTLLKQNDQEDKSSLDDFKMLYEKQKSSYIYLKNDLDKTEFKCQ